MHMKLLGIANVDFDVIGRLIRFSISVGYRRKSGSIMVQYISCFYMSRKPMIRLGGKNYTVFSLSLEYPGNLWG
jgi:hypothetical protein